MSEPSGERTEEAPEQKVREAREKGQIGVSSDLVAWLGVGAAAATIPAVAGSMQSSVTGALAGVRDVIASPEPALAVDALGRGLGGVLPAIGPMLAAVAIAAVAGTVVQSGIHFVKPVPKFEQFNPVSGAKRIFGLRAAWEGVKAVLKTAVVGGVLVAVLQSLLPVLSGAGLTLGGLLDAAGGAVGMLVIAAVLAGLAVAAADLFVVLRRNRKSTRMTKQEFKDENKRTEGDPIVRSARRSRQLSMGRNRMIAAVGTADVVVLNPTHIAVALQYEAGRSAPRVVAKGHDAVAARIRERATEARVPMVQDVPLARALDAACEVGHEIPAELYTAVAKVLAFVMSLKARGAALGTHTLTPVR